MKNVLKNYPKLKVFYSYTILLSIVCSILLLLATNSMSVLTTYITEHGLISVSIYVFKVLLFFVGFHFTNYFIFKILKSKIQEYLNKSVYLKLNAVLTGTLDNSLEQGNLYTLIQNDATESITFLSDTWVDILYQSIRLILVLIYIFLLNLPLSMIYITAILLSTVIQKKFSSLVSQANNVTKETEIKMNTILRNVLDNRLTIKMYHADKFAKDLYQEKVNNYTDAYLNVESKALPFRMIGIFLGLLPILSLCVAGLYLIKNNVVSLVTFLSIEYICNCVVYDQLHFSDFITESAKAFISVNRITQFCLNRSNDNLSQKNTTNDITLKNVTFHYPNTNTLSLNHLSLNIPCGNKVAIVGKSGCGKSTLLKLIASIIKQNTGYADIPEVTFVDQFPFLFTDTVKNNITCWDDIHEDKYQHILSLCKIKDFLKNDQIILKKNASNLSGGQMQRIALARALLNPKQVLVLDEIFSSMDSKNALDILQCILNEYKDHTVIISIHQLELLKLMERIIVLEKGTIVFDGTYKEYEEKYGNQ